MPPGLRFVPEFLSESAEAGLISELRAVELYDVKMRGVVALRRTRHYGYDYGYDSWKVTPAEPIPRFLLELREQAIRAGAPGGDPSGYVEVLVSWYPPGAGIGWHRDAPMFGPTVIGVSVLSDCQLRFRRALERRTRPETKRKFERATVELPRRSLYALTGPARSEWQHSIDAAPAERYSITFRSLLTPPA